MKAFLEVDVEDIAEVARYVEQLRARRVRGSATPISSDDETVVVHKQGPWTRSEIDKLAENLTLGAVAHLFDICAQRGGWVPKYEAEGEGEGEFTKFQVRAELSGFTKRLASGDLLGVERDYWPIEWRKRDRVYEYRFPPEIASWWAEARSKGRVG